MGFSLQFAQLTAFFVAAAAPILFLAYLRQRNKQRKLVSSIFLLDQLKKNSIIKKRFRPPLNSLFELLALLFLVCALAQPFLLSDQQRVAIILDNSLSMKAAGPSGESRLELAKNELSSWLSKQDSSATYSLFSLSPTLKLISGENVSRSEIEAALESVRISLTSDNVTASVMEAAESGKFENVLLVSDNQILFDEDEPSDLLKNSPSTRIDSLKIGSSVPNYFLQSVRLIRKASAEGGRVLMATLGYSGESEAEIEATVLFSNRSLPQSNNEYKVAITKSILLSPNRAQHVEIELPASTRSGRSFILELSASATVSNSLQEDDKAVISSAKSAQHSILVVAPRGISARDLGLHRLTNFTFTIKSPEEYSKLRGPDFKNFGMVMFYQTAPVSTPPISSLLVLPPEENSLFPVAQTISSPTLSSWDTSHPMLTYLRVPVLAPPSTQLFDVPVWARSVLNTEKGSAAAVAESRGIRFTAIGFEIFPFEGKSTPAVSILLINTFRWLLGSEKVGAGFRTGSQLDLKGDKTWVIAAPDGGIETIETTESKPRSYIFSTSGLYNVTSIGTDLSDSVQKNSQIIAVNPFFPIESATARTQSVELPTLVEHRQISKESSTKLWWLALVAALVMLLIDFLIRVLRTDSKANKLSEAGA